jgi:hypothetical protein
MSAAGEADGEGGGEGGPAVVGVNDVNLSRPQQSSEYSDGGNVNGSALRESNCCHSAMLSAGCQGGGKRTGDSHIDAPLGQIGNKFGDVALGPREGIRIAVY